MRVVPRYKNGYQALPRRLRWTRARVPTRRQIPKLYRPEGRVVERPSARVSLLHLMATIAVAMVLWAAGTVFKNAYAGRIYPHVTIDHVPVGGMTRAEALAALRYTESARVKTPIFVQAGDKTWQVTPAQFGVRYDIASAVDRALGLAHGGPFILGGWEEIQTIWHGANVPLTGTHNAAQVTRFLAGIARAVHVAPRGASVGVKGDDVAIVSPPVDGRRLDVARAAAALGTAVNTHDTTAVTLPLQPVESALGEPQAEAAISRARALLAAPIRFQWTANSAQSPSWQLSRSGILRLLTFTPRCTATSCRFELGINVHKLAEAFNRGGVALAVDRAPTPASYLLYAASDPRASSVQVVPDTPGDAIDVAAAATLILQQANVPAASRVIYLPTRPLTAGFTRDAALALHFDQDVGVSSARFSGTDWARRDNLNVAANVISDTIVQPGQTFSLAREGGPFNQSGGYRPGQNTVSPGDITGVNSGVDLLGSAVLAAAYDAGLPIVQRAHYPYLNAFTLPGLDAMVSYGTKRSPDLVFRNTTDHPILVMTSNDGLGGVSVYIFNRAGYAPGHQRGAYTTQTSPPQITLNPDGSVDTTITRQIAVGGHTTQDRLSSHYVPLDP